MLKNRLMRATIAVALLAAGPAMSQQGPPGGQPGQGVLIPQGGSGGDDGVERVDPRLAEVAVVRGGRRAEWLIFGTPAQVAAAEAALQNAGAVLLRRRGLPAFSRQITIFDLRGLRVSRAVTLAGAARVAPNHLYRHAQGGAPRLYAARVTGDRGCVLPSAIRVGVIDSAVDPGHPALAGARIFQASTRAERQRPGGGSHGTAVAGLIVGRGAFGGFAPGASLYLADAFSRDRGAPAADVDRIGGALDWMARNRVSVVNMSFAGPPNPVLAELLALASQRMLLVAAMGNSGRTEALWPAASDRVIAVTAVDAARRGYRRATTGAHVEVAAPGVDVWVAKGRGGGYASGTSYAAPIITAFSARLLARGQSRDAVRRTLSRTAQDLGQPGRDTRFGHGLAIAPGC